MCYAQIAGQAAGAVTGAYGSWRQGQAAMNAANYQAGVAEMNADQLDLTIKDIEENATEDKKEIAREYSAQKGEGRGSYAANNVVVGQGSALSWEEDIDAAMGSDIETTEYNAQLNIWETRNRARNLRHEAQNMRIAGKNARRAANMAAIGSLLGGGTSIASTYSSYTANQTQGASPQARSTKLGSNGR